MPHYIVKFETPHGDRYLMWSSVFDAPVMYGLPLEQFKAQYKTEYGDAGMKWLDERMRRVEESGTSDALDRSPTREWIIHNRAGTGEESMSYDELVEVYCPS